MTKPLPFEPEDFSQVWALAHWLQNSQLIPSALRGKPADLLIVIATGRELGLSPMQSLRSLHVVDGKPGMSAELIAARIRSSKVCRYLRLVESTDEIATYVTQRVEDDTPTTISFTIEEARSMGLAGKDNYRKQAATMLRARCISKTGRAVYQDVMSGVYEIDELNDIASTSAAVIDSRPPEPKSVAALASLAKKKADPAAATNAQAPTTLLQPPQEAPGAATAATNARATPTLLQPTTPTVEPETASALEEPPLEDEQAPAAPAPAAPAQLSGRELVLEIERLAPLVGAPRFRKLCEALAGDPGGIGFGLNTAHQRELLASCKAALDKKAT